MAQKQGIYVFDANSEDFSTTGLVGDLRPLEATFTEEKNGTSEIVLKLPYDELHKWRSVKVGSIIKCNVPVRVPPVISNDEYSGSVKVISSAVRN